MLILTDDAISISKVCSVDIRKKERKESDEPAPLLWSRETEKMKRN